LTQANAREGLSGRLGDSTDGVIAASTGEEVAGRDANAFVAMVEPILPAAYRLAVGMLRSRYEAEDAVQEAMYKAWRSFGRFRGTEMKPWLLTIVANECRQMLRSRWWSVIRSEEELQTEPDTRPDDHTQRTDLRRALRRLSMRQRLVLVLRYYLDLSFEEMAVILNTNPKAAKSRTYRALERLRLSPEVMAGD
jgi:RNA polymerase sigma-70 factor, ECF subfamily